MEYIFSDKLASMKPSAIREIFKSLADPTIISFAAGNPSPLSFPAEEFGALAADIFANHSTAALQYGTTEGYTPLIGEVDKRLESKFNIKGDGDQTIITTGGQQGIELACKALCNEGDTVVCENPSFIGALNAFRSCGCETVGVPLSDDGINTDELEKTLEANPKAKLLYLIPTFHNPAGITSTLENRKQVYEIALRHKVIIIEDNPYGELRFAGEDVPTIKSIDTEGIVLYCSSFSKILSAGMRVGFIRGPREVIQKMVIAKQVEDVHTNNFFQMLCYRFITEYDLDAHIEKIRELYRNKCSLMLDCLDKNLPACIKYTRPEGGLFIWCTLPDELDAKEFVQRALVKKVAVVPGATFNPDQNAPSQSFRLNYSTPSDEAIIRGVEALGEVAREMIK
ncbi:MAG: PLP-dependent aminotransferase family protein [Clostridia bacterium]|nr:PLP-dependent aminotransferase family protein [Clostridia bacterium]